MDKYEQTLHRILRETSEDNLTWESVSPTSHSEILVNPDRVVRAMKSELQLGSRHFPLLFAERKVLVHNEYDEPLERLEWELYVLDQDDRLVFPIYEGLVDRDDLAKLSAIISDSNKSAKEFFQALSETG